MSSENTATGAEDGSLTQATTVDENRAGDLSPDPAFDPLLSTLEQMTTAPIMLPATLPTELKSAVIGNDPSTEDGPYTTRGDKYAILFLNPNSYPLPDPTQIVQPYAHYKVAGTLTAGPVGDPSQQNYDDFSAGGATVYQLGNVALSDGTVAELLRIVPNQGANYVPFTVGTFEKEGERYTLRIEVDSPEGDSARQVLSTMVEVTGNT